MKGQGAWFYLWSNDAYHNLPQMFKRVLPPLANETINLLKDTSLVYVLAMNDILRITKSIVQRDFDIFCVPCGRYILSNLYIYFDKYL